VGEGVKKEALIQYANDHHLNQVHFIPYQPRAMLAEVLAVADISIVTLNPASASYSMPNKIYNIMASGRGVIVIAPQESELAQLVQNADCGICVPPGSPELIAETILSLKNNPNLLDKLGKNGRAYLEAHFSRQICMDEYVSLFKHVAQC
jgi:colanic acid biosynthesis glycosyl transferase WcaI